MKKCYTAHLSFLLSVIFSLCLINEESMGQTSLPRTKQTIVLYDTLPENIFLKKWLILGPVGNAEITNVTPGKSNFKNAFDTDIVTQIKITNGPDAEPIKYNGKTYQWANLDSETENINLSGIFGDTSNVICYATAEIISKKDQTLLFGLGSDDGVKVWINGQNIHSNFTSRALTTDEDIIEIPLQKGQNNIVLKIQNGMGSFGFSLRPLDKNKISELLIRSAGRGKLDEVKKYLKYNPEISAKDTHGLTAWQVVKIAGRKEIAIFLKNHGADTTFPFPSISEILTNIYTPIVKQGTTPGTAILVASHGKIIYENGFGYANVEKREKFTPEIRFRIGSVSKQFTASAILRLYEENKIQLTDKLSDYIPEFPRGDEVTIHHLLTHTSGIHSYTNRPDFIDNVEKATTNKEVLDIIMTENYDFDPGEDYLYNNSGYFILGYLIELITHKPLEEYLRDEFFVPLGLENTGTYKKGLNLAHEAVGYTYENNSYKPTINWDMTWAGGAGALYSTVEDLFKWNEALFHGKVLSDESLKKAFTPVYLNNGTLPYNNRYGYGWSLNPYRNTELISHGGGLNGFLCFLLRQPGEELTIAVFANCTPSLGETNPTQQSFQLFEYLLHDMMAEQPSYSMDKAPSEIDLEKYTGRYDYGMGMILTVSLEGNHLYAQMTGQQAFEIFPLKNDTFFWKIVEARIEFTWDNNGQINGGTHFQAGQQIPVTKLPENPQ